MRALRLLIKLIIPAATIKAFGVPTKQGGNYFSCHRITEPKKLKKCGFNINWHFFGAATKRGHILFEEILRNLNIECLQYSLCDARLQVLYKISPWIINDPVTLKLFYFGILAIESVSALDQTPPNCSSPSGKLSQLSLL